MSKTKDTSNEKENSADVKEESKVPAKGDIFDLNKVNYEKLDYKMEYPSASAQNRGLIAKNDALKILENFHKFSSSENHSATFRAFALIIQEGGANRSKNNVTVKVDGIEFT